MTRSSGRMPAPQRMRACASPIRASRPLPPEHGGPPRGAARAVYPRTSRGSIRGSRRRRMRGLGRAQLGLLHHGEAARIREARQVCRATRPPLPFLAIERAALPRVPYLLAQLGQDERVRARRAERIRSRAASMDHRGPGRRRDRSAAATPRDPRRARAGWGRGRERPWGARRRSAGLGRGRERRRRATISSGGVS